MNEVTLQCLLIFQSMFTHELLRFFRLLPPTLGTFVSANMDILAGEQVTQFRKHIFQKVENFRFGRQHVTEFIEDTPRQCRFLRLIRRSTELRIGGKDSHAVTGNIYFGYHRDVTFGSIAHYLAHIFMGIISAIRQRLVFSRIKSEDFPFTDGTFLCQFRSAFHFNTPGLVVCQMPVEIVEFMQCKIIDILLNE